MTQAIEKRNTPEYKAFVNELANEIVQVYKENGWDVPNKEFNALTPATMDFKEFNEKLSQFIGNLKVVMSMVNYIAITSTMNAVEAIKETPLFKREIKKDINQVIPEYQRHLVALKNCNVQGVDIFRPISEDNDAYLTATREQLFQIYLEFGQNEYKYVSRHVAMLELQVLQAMTTSQTPHRAALAKVCTAYMLLKYSETMFGFLMNDCKVFLKADMEYIFRPFCMDKVIFHFGRAARACGLAKYFEEYETLNNEKNIRTAVEVFERAVMKAIGECKGADETMQNHRDIMREGCYEKYREEYDTVSQEHYERDHRSYDDIMAERKAEKEAEQAAAREAELKAAKAAEKAEIQARKEAERKAIEAGKQEAERRRAERAKAKAEKQAAAPAPAKKYNPINAKVEKYTGWETLIGIKDNSGEEVFSQLKGCICITIGVDKGTKEWIPTGEYTIVKGSRKQTYGGKNTRYTLKIKDGKKTRQISTATGCFAIIDKDTLTEIPLDFHDGIYGGNQRQTWFDKTYIHTLNAFKNDDQN